MRGKIIMPALALAFFLLRAIFCLPAEGQVVINEVLAQPNQDWNGDLLVGLKADEWIEVKNQGPETSDLSEYFLRDDFGTDPHLQLSGLLEPGQVKVFYGSEALDWQLANGYHQYGFALDNWGETVELLRQEGETLIVVDQVTLQHHETQFDRSGGYELGNRAWALFDAWNTYQGQEQPGSSGCQPTPGQPNNCEPLVAVETMTWETVKARYH